MPFLGKSGRIVTVGSGAGPMYVRGCSKEVKKMRLAATAGENRSGQAVQP